MSDLELLVHELSEVREKWEFIGRELRVGVYDISYSDPTDCLRLMLKKWLRWSIVTTTWGDIIAALRTPGLGASKLANQLEAKYIPGVLATTTQFLHENNFICILTL